MIGRVKSISRFGIFITFLASELSSEERTFFEDVSDTLLLTGLLRWSMFPKVKEFKKMMP